MEPVVCLPYSQVYFKELIGLKYTLYNKISHCLGNSEQLPTVP
jgi:hypothetical protein